MMPYRNYSFLPYFPTPSCYFQIADELIMLQSHPIVSSWCFHNYFIIRDQLSLKIMKIIVFESKGILLFLLKDYTNILYIVY